MKRCLACNTAYFSSAHLCPSCGKSPEVIDGFQAYAPESANLCSGFNPIYFAQLAALENNNFWFRARNQLILWALSQYCPNFTSFLEIGCGTGYVLSGVSEKFKHANIYGSEIFIEGLHFARNRLPKANFMQMDARKIPFQEEFDVIGAFDVLEHIEEDETVLAQMHTALKPRGFILITVPQHAWLWSSVDQHACHVRRYSAAELHQKINCAGFEIIRSTSFVTTLLPAMLISRALQKKVSEKKFDPEKELKVSPWLNHLFFKFLKIELSLIKRNLNLPIGGSRLVIARKIG